MPESNLSQMIETALANIKKMTDANTVVGEPIKVSGTTVIPVSKISVGFASGGMDYQSKSAPEKSPNFGGGTGSGFTITPIAFLTVDEIGSVSLLNLGTAAEGGKDTFGKIGEILEKAPSTIEKIAKMFKKDRETPGDGETEEPSEAAPENGGN